jgi:Flp pilus assembly protein TadD
MSSLLKRAAPALAAMLLVQACQSTPPAPAAPPSVELYRDHRWSALDAGRYQDALRNFQQVQKVHDDDPMATLGLGEAHLGLNQLDLAAEQFQRLDHAAPLDARARALQGRGIILLRRGDHQAAARLLGQAVRLDAGLWRAWNGLGRARDAAGAHGHAKEAYSRAIELAPGEALLHNNLGFSLLSADDLTGAEQAFRQALRHDPELKAAETNLRLTLALQGRYDLALTGVAGKERPAALNNVGYGAILRGDYIRARRFLTQAMAASPTFFDAARRNLAFLADLEAGRVETRK